jgi:hypothetical protein
VPSRTKAVKLTDLTYELNVMFSMERRVPNTADVCSEQWHLLFADSGEFVRWEFLE